MAERLTDRQRTFLIAIDLGSVEWRVVQEGVYWESRRHFIPWIGSTCYRTEHTKLKDDGLYTIKKRSWPERGIMSELTPAGREALGDL